MVRIAVLGCGRIGRMHAANIAAHPRAALGGVSRRASPGGRGRLRARIDAPVLRVGRGRLRQRRRRCRPDRQLHPDAFRPASRPRSPPASRCSARSRSISASRGSTAAPMRIRGTALPIMLGFVRRFDPGHRAVAQAVRDGRVGDLHQVVDHLARSRPGAASAISRTSGGHLPRHDDPRLRHGPLRPRRGGRRPSPPSAAGWSTPPTDGRAWTTTTPSTVRADAPRPASSAVITNSRRATYGYDQRVEAFGSNGMVISENRAATNNATFYGAGFTGRGAPLLELLHRALRRGLRRRDRRPSSTRSRRVSRPRSGSTMVASRWSSRRRRCKSAAEGRIVQRQRDRVSGMYQKFGLFIGGSWTRRRRRGTRRGHQPGHREAARRGAGCRAGRHRGRDRGGRRAASPPGGRSRPSSGPTRCTPSPTR